MFKNSHAFSGFSVDNLAAAKEFYGQTLGINVSEDAMGLTLHLAGGTEIFVYAKDSHTPASFTILNFVVKDIDSAVDQLAAKGISIEHYDNLYQDEKGITRGLGNNQGPDIAWFKDPAGNILSVLQDK